MFIDRAKVRVKAGDGGDGCIDFRREKFVPKGGPDGGDGGNGGSVYFVAQPGENTLLKLHSQPEYRADRGAHGKGKKRTGGEGEDVMVMVPLGTVVYDQDKEETVGELMFPGEKLLVAKGGDGGKGNVHFATARRRVPRMAQPGFPGEERHLLVELKLVAEGGLVGLPNAGKSTLLGQITQAHPRIADYPFTTRYPVLGTFGLPGGEKVILADIPGIIAGASEGVGLGLEFLRHVERTRFLVYVLDVAQVGEWGPAGALSALRHEIGVYSQNILDRPALLVLNKVDLLEDRSELPVILAQLRKVMPNLVKPITVISGLTGEGVEEFRVQLREFCLELRAAEPVVIAPELAHEEYHEE